MDIMKLTPAFVVDRDGYKTEFVNVDMSNHTPSVFSYHMRDGEILVFDHLDVADRMVRPRWNGVAWVETATPYEIEATLPSIEVIRAAKLAEIDKARETEINKGITIDTSLGTRNFSLTDRDQMNLGASRGELMAAMAGLPSAVDLSKGVFYHADGHPHTFWSPVEFNNICFAAFAFVTERIIYYKNLRAYVQSLMTRADLEEVYYGMEIYAG